MTKQQKARTTRQILTHIEYLVEAAGGKLPNRRRWVQKSKFDAVKSLISEALSALDKENIELAKTKLNQGLIVRSKSRESIGPLEDMAHGEGEEHVFAPR